jgi:hypothetical protein
MRQGVGWILISDDQSGVEQTQIVPGVAYGLGQSQGGGAAVNEATGEAIAPASPVSTVQSFQTTGIVPVTMTVQIPFDDTVNISNPVMGQNLSRGVLTLQNNSSATATGDVPPTLYIGYARAAVVGQCFALLPGVGLWLDRAVPIDAIFVAWGPYTNTSGSVVISGFAGSGSIVTS